MGGGNLNAPIFRNWEHTKKLEIVAGIVSFCRQSRDFAHFHLKMKRRINVRCFNELILFIAQVLLSCETDTASVTE